MMKFLFSILLLYSSSLFSGDLSDSLRKQLLSEPNLSQVNELKKFSAIDFSNIWTLNENNGFVSDSLNRFRIKFCSVRKQNKIMYRVNGFVNYEGYTYSLTGNILLCEIRLKKPVDEKDCDPNNYPYKKIKAEGTIIANFMFALLDSDSLRGACGAYWFMDSVNVLHIDNRRSCADGYINNQFAGMWINLSSHQTNAVAWGDYRIPFSRDLDIGVGEFCPDKKYASRGWQSYLDAYYATQSSSNRHYQVYPEKDSIYWPCEKNISKHPTKNRK